MNVTSVALGDDGNVYVLDQGANHIRVFDSAGAELRTIGREGQGPGEFGRPYSLAWIGDTLAVLDPGNGRIELVTTDGRHAATWRGSRITGRDVRLWQAGPSRIFLDSYRPTADGKMQMLFVSAGPDARDTLVIPERTGADEVTAVTCKLPNGAITWFDVPFASVRIRAVSPEGFLVIGRTGDYRFTWYDGAGQPQRMMAFGADTIPIPDAYWDSVRTEYRAWRDKLVGADCDRSDLPRPPHKDFVRAVTFDDQGRMWVEAVTADGFRLDAWVPEAGRRVAALPAPERNPDVLFAVRGDRLALVADDDEGQRVVVYRIPGASISPPGTS
ncbi:MAG TPA: 6-bladed beta-propeller [Gemmatimonadales bacterium]